MLCSTLGQSWSKTSLALVALLPICFSQSRTSQKLSAGQHFQYRNHHWGKFSSFKLSSFQVFNYITTGASSSFGFPVGSARVLQRQFWPRKTRQCWPRKTRQGLFWILKKDKTGGYFENIKTWELKVPPGASSHHPQPPHCSKPWYDSWIDIRLK